MKKAIRILTTILALSIVTAIYCIIAVPALEPQSKYIKVNKTNKAFEISNPQIVALFKPDDWELTDAQRYKFNRKNGNDDISTFYIFVKSYEFQKNNTIQLNKCTVVITNSARPNKAVIIRCDGIMTCFFEQAIKLSSLFSNDPNSRNRFLGANYIGKVSIVSKGDGDNISFETHDFRIERGAISTDANVYFRYGRTQGVGTGMEIQFISNGLFGLMQEFSYKISGIKVQKLQRLTIVPPAQKQSVQNDKANLFNAPIELHCDGIFEFNALKKNASFQENVSLIQTVSNKAPNSIRCQLLKLYFSSANRQNDNTEAEESTRNSESDSQFNEWDLQLARLEATGRMVVIEAPEYQTKIHAGKLVANLSPLSFEIESPTHCEFYYKNHLISTPNMVYKIGEKGTLGTLECSSGWIRSQMKQDGKQIRARWSNSLLLEPDPNDSSESIVSIQGSALLEMENNNKIEAAITADNISFWLTQKKNVSTSDGFGEVDLSRMLANKNVVLKSNPITATVKTIQLWFEDLDKEDVNSSNPPATQTSSAQDPESLLSTPCSYQVSGNLLQGKIQFKQGQLQIEKLTLKDDIRVVQNASASSGNDNAGRMEMTGAQIQLYNLTLPSASASLIGQPAVIRYNNATLTGYAINVNRGINRIWIDSKGSALFKPSENAQENSEQIVKTENETSDKIGFLVGAPQNAASMLPAKIQWTKSMIFQDNALTFSGDVTLKRKDQNAQCDTLSIILNKKIDFQNLNSLELQNSLDVRYVVLNNSVVLKNDVIENGVTMAKDSLKASKLTIDIKNQKFVAEGPGQAATKRIKPGESGESGEKQAASGENAQSDSQNPLSKLAVSSSPLISLSVDFQKRLEGLYAPNSLSTFIFFGRVEAVYFPIDNIENEVKTANLSQMPPDAFTLNCDRMEIQAELGNAERGTGNGNSQEANSTTASRSSLPTPYSGVRAGAFIASGSVKVEGKVYNAQADKITFETKNNTMTLEGDGQIPAQFFYQKVPGGHYSQATSSIIYYNTQTGAVRGEGMQDFTLFLSPKSSSE